MLKNIRTLIIEVNKKALSYHICNPTSDFASSKIHISGSIFITDHCDILCFTAGVIVVDQMYEYNGFSKCYHNLTCKMIIIAVYSLFGIFLLLSLKLMHS